MKPTAQEVVDALEQVTPDVYERYSGKCMYGEKCPGFTCDSDSGAFSVFVKLAIQNPVLAGILARGAKTDAMGRGIVVYFPSVTYPKGA